MATRATYQFRRRLDTHTVYVHHDGYPAGAAHYFAAAVDLYGHGALCERFLRANDNAELTAGHDVHGDTEYRYTVRANAESIQGPDTLRVDKRYGETWQVFWTGSLAEFLNKEIQDGRKWATLGRECVTVQWLTDTANAKLAESRVVRDRGWLGNASGLAGDAARLIGAGAQVPEDVLRAALEYVCRDWCEHMVAYHLKEAGFPEVAAC